ncbi:PREDICTED: uncharacterized protein LOC105574373 [Cercocebus atys]|uniref:uncharacterized protein LOC105574373 n=1 Tax=Cercocebus atys TaxID=9531 RepID=UPI0005F4842E|nr:PREDICTED: uncharacterized protein LOC105574373 [Cercocebus atys]
MSGMGPTAVRTTPSDRHHCAEAASARRQGRRQAAGLPGGHTQPRAASLLSGGRLPFLPSGSRTQRHTREQEPELLLWGSTGKWALVSERGAVLEPVCTGVFQTPPQGVNQGNSRTGPHAHCSHLPAAPHSKVFCHPLGGKINYLWTWTCPSSCEYPHICCRNATVGTQGGAHISPGELDSERPRLCSPGATQSIPRPGARVGRGLRTVSGDPWQQLLPGWPTAEEEPLVLPVGPREKREHHDHVSGRRTR